MACGCSPEDQEQVEYFAKMGLVGGHAYGLLNAHEFVDDNGNNV